MCLSIPFFGSRNLWLWLVGAALVGYALYRCFSKNIEARQRERFAFMNAARKTGEFFMKVYAVLKPFFLAVGRFFKSVGAFFKKIAGFFKSAGERNRQRKDYVFVRCPKCHSMLRLPRHKGKLMVTCTVCRHEFIKKT
jgi:hypothetical protein